MNNKISLRTKLGFGAGEFSSSIFFTITSFWLLNFLTDEVRLSAAMAGTALLIGKIWDAVIDPFIGNLSDRTRSKLGRRRPYILYFSIPFGIGFVLMFTNPGIASQSGKFLWVLLTYIFFCTVYSFTNIPYNSLLPEMTSNYNERTSISGFKQIFAVLGTLLGAGAALPIMSLFGNRTAGFTGMAAIFGFMATVSLLVTFFSVREPLISQTQPKTNILASLKEVISNKPYLLLMLTWFSNSTAVAIMQTMLIYYYKYVFQKEDAVTMAMITLLVVSMLTIPFWVWLAKRMDKKYAYLAGMSLTLLSVMVFAFAADRMGTSSALILMAIAGIGFSSHYVVPWSMAPDTIEFGFFKSGVRREGVYYSIWTFVVAFGGALAGFIVGQGLELGGYIPDAVQSATSIQGMRMLIGILPAIFILIGNLSLLFYPLSRKRYEALLQAASGGVKITESDARID